MSQSNGAEVVAFCVIATMVIVCGAIVTWFGVPWTVALEVLPKLLVWGVVLGCAMYFGFFGSTWPIFLGTLIKVFSPVLNHWAGGRFGDPLYIEPAWYGESVWQFTMAATLIGAGYGLKLWWNNRYSY